MIGRLRLFLKEIDEKKLLCAVLEKYKVNFFYIEAEMLGLNKELSNYLQILLLYFSRTIHQINTRKCCLLTNVLKFCTDRIYRVSFGQKIRNKNCNALGHIYWRNPQRKTSIFVRWCTFLCNSYLTFHAFEQNVELRHTLWCFAYVSVFYKWLNMF